MECFPFDSLFSYDYQFID